MRERVLGQKQPQQDVVDEGAQREREDMEVRIPFRVRRGNSPGAPEQPERCSLADEEGHGQY